MRVIIEGYCYRASAVRDVLRELSSLENVGGEISVGYVGYYYHPQLRDCVFILPKVLVNEENKVFSRLDPHDIIDLDHCTELSSEERSFIYEFAVWIYRAIEVFNKSNPNSGIVLHRKIAEMGKGKRVLSNTFLDILLSLLRFNKERHSFFTTILRNLHSGYNKINWTRTISRSTAWVQNDVPVYLNPVNKKRQINTDEELIIIYFSILNHISETYGFPVDITLGFELIKGRKFEHYLKGYGKRRLQQIKYRYFSDIQLRLWEMCYAFFDKAHQIHIVAEQREYLLVKNFNIVFEAIIDELIGDKEPPRGLKDQDDGKRVDHIYSYRNLTNNEEDRPIYYIGDSKYYKIGNMISDESVYKQFTYARNVIQWNLNLFLDKSEKDAALRKEHPIYRDELTEGYNIVPNFFISAKMDEKLSYADNVSTTNRENNTFLSRHFENRLFDRDTLLVYHYDVNFLYVVSLYARENAHQKAQWKQKVRELFREKIQAALEENYKFYAMTPKSGLNHEKYLRENFQELLGKVYRPFDDTNYLSLALDKQKESENKDLLDKLQKDYYVVECPLGKNPTSVLSGEKAQNSSEAVHGRKGVLMVMMEKYATKSANFTHGKLAVAIKMTVESMDIVENLSNIGYVLFHHRSDNDQHLFSVKGTCIIKAAGELEDDRYKNIGNKELYISVDIDTTELSSGNLHASMIKPASKETRYDAQFAWLSDLESDNSKVAE
ncbi:restriction endonuclease [Prevotella melaninogenica]|uniref:LlaJI family restriction endonuclease n=1 Tax=Prevotella melaninogenica TaxID=28132 RepID=UPI001CAF215B|nr:MULTISPECIES: LlaJI family restriction endonuclease [Prevotella]MBF1603003.1 restriction endonuclease [Prevotella sp.]MBF1625198.1 restriction endonuclease [Prevotella sp.]UEB00308.1 restriction endonuclease [Prevotella melaninogenica]